jgi:RHS repeat-associated protein
VDLVTEIDGYAHEFFIYNPWGEEMHQWNANTYAFTSPYRFNSKELDPETGLAYYGARYYQNKMGVWLSVDPLAHETFEPYQFSSNNPINFIDPDGKSIDPSSEEAGELLLNGIRAVLGVKNPFYYDKEKKQLKFNNFNRNDFTSGQLELIDRTVSLINDNTEKHHVHVVDRNELITTTFDGQLVAFSLANSGEGTAGNNGATINNISWIARDASKPGLVANPKYGPKYPFEKEMISGLVALDHIGIVALHEVVGHQYENKFNPSLHRNQRNQNVTEFETRMRSQYQIGQHSFFSSLIRKGIKRGDPIFLGGAGEQHRIY